MWSATAASSVHLPAIAILTIILLASQLDAVKPSHQHPPHHKHPHRSLQSRDSFGGAELSRDEDVASVERKLLASKKKPHPPGHRGLIEMDSTLNSQAMLDAENDHMAARQLLSKKHPKKKRPPPPRVGGRGLLSTDSAADDAIFEVEARAYAERQLQSAKKKVHKTPRPPHSSGHHGRLLEAE